MARARTWVAVGGALAGLAAFAAALPGAAQERSPRINYILRCAGCHGVNGEGVPAGGIPAFPGFVGVFAGDDEGRTYLFHVPGVVGSSLTNAEIAAVMNYIMETWAGPSLPPVFVPFTGEEVTERRAIPVDNLVAFRRTIVARLAALGLVAAEYPWP